VSWSCLVATATVLELRPIGRSHAPTSCLCTGRKGPAKWRFPFVHGDSAAGLSPRRCFCLSAEAFPPVPAARPCGQAESAGGPMRSGYGTTGLAAGQRRKLLPQDARDAPEKRVEDVPCGLGW
jgi:hypothetical protein